MLLLSPILLLMLAEARPPFRFVSPVQPPRRVQAMAHRGLWQSAPENTRPALEACIQHSVEWAEVDLRLSKDGKHVLIHNDRVDGITDGTGRVKDLTLAELVKLDAGEPYARRYAGTPLISLETGLALSKGRLNLYLDCKEIDPKRLVEEIRSSGMERQVVVYANPDVLERVQEAVGTGQPIALMRKWHPGKDSADSLARLKGLAAVEVDADEVTPEVCKSAHAQGWLIQAKVLGSEWDREEVWGRVADAGVDWVQTDWPIEFQAFLVNRAFRKRPVGISCHRGALHQAPENTLSSIKAALAMGADYVELDVRTTKDGKLVLLHDSKLDRTTNGTGPVSLHSLDEVRQLDAGSWFGTMYRGIQVPTLDEGLAALKGKARFYCDAKDVAPEALRDALRKHGLIDDTVVYAGIDAQRRLKAITPELKRMPPLGRIEDIDRLAKELEPYAFDVKWSILSRELVDRCHAKGIKVFSDALGLHENVGEYQRALAIGVDVIQTDYPERVLRAIELKAR